MIKQIGEYACANGLIEELDMSLTAITIIDKSAFSNCSRLTKVIFPDTYISLYSNSFVRSGLKELSIPDKMINFTGAAFNQAYYIRIINVHPNNPKFTSLNNCIFTKNFEKLVRVGSLVTEIPNMDLVNTIGEFAFAGSLAYTKFIGTKTLSVIENFGFHAANGLKHINLSICKINVIEYYTFRSIPSLSYLLLPFNTTTIKSSSIVLNSIKTLIIPPSVTSIDNDAIMNCSSLKIVSYTGLTDFSRDGLILYCPIKEIRVTQHYPSSYFSSYLVLHNALEYTVMETTVCETYIRIPFDINFVMSSVFMTSS